jgi:hypothetical protein
MVITTIKGRVISRKSRSPSPKAPSPCWGFFVHSSCGVPGHQRQNENPPKNLPKYTAEQISEIVDRINTLRMGWLRQVEAQLASRQSHSILDDYQFSGEPAE